jgi:hypothetical protein
MEGQGYRWTTLGEVLSHTHTHMHTHMHTHSHTHTISCKSLIISKDS